MPSWFNGGRRPKPPVTPTVEVSLEPPDHIRGAGTKHQQLWARLLVNSRRDLRLSVPDWLLRLSRGEDVRGDPPTGNPGSSQGAANELKDAYDALRATMDEGRSRLRRPGPEQARADLLAGPDRQVGEAQSPEQSAILDWDAILQWNVGQDIVRDDFPFYTAPVHSSLKTLFDVIEDSTVIEDTFSANLSFAAMMVGKLRKQEVSGQGIERNLNLVREAIGAVEDEKLRMLLTRSYLNVLVAAEYRSRDSSDPMASGGGFLGARSRLARSRTSDLDDLVDLREHPGPPPVPRGMSGESRPPTRAPNAPATQQGQ